jgi:hypothetical protein
MPQSAAAAGVSDTFDCALVLIAINHSLGSVRTVPASFGHIAFRRWRPLGRNLNLIASNPQDGQEVK